MITEIVEVVDTAKNKTIVRFSRKPMCANCKFSSACGKDADDLVNIENVSIALKKGDRIEVGIEEKKSILVSCLMFLIPMIIFVVLLVIFKHLNELLSFTIAVSVLFCYYLVVRLIIKRMPKYFNLEVIRKI
jgi:positive regulator of sigma E activity